MATPSVEVPWHQRRSTYSSSPKLSLRSFSSSPLNSPKGELPFNSLLGNTTPLPIGTRCSPTSGCDTPINFAPNSHTFEKHRQASGMQSGSLFRVGTFNPLLSRCLIQMHLNRILYSQPPTFYNAFAPNVLLNVCAQTHSEQSNPQPSTENKKCSDVPDESDIQAVTEDKPLTAGEVSALSTDIETAESALPQLAQLSPEDKQIHENENFPTFTQIPADSKEDGSLEVIPESPTHSDSVVVNPQTKSGSDTSGVVAWQPQDQRKPDSDIKAVNDDIIVANDNGSEQPLPCEYAINLTCPEDGNDPQADYYSDEDDNDDAEPECELHESDSDSNDEDDDDFIEFSDESLEGLGFLPEASTHQLAPHPKQYDSLLSAESGYFEGAVDTVPSCDENNDSDGGDSDSDDDCEKMQGNVSCEALWKVFEEQAFSPIPCSKKATTKCSQLFSEAKSAHMKTDSSSSNVSEPSSHFTTTFEHDTEGATQATNSKSTRKLKCVRFKPDSELVEVHHMVTWNYAYKASRKCYWEQFACDRLRFKRRVSNLAPILEPCLAKKVANFSSCSSRNFNSHCVFVR